MLGYYYKNTTKLVQKIKYIKKDQKLVLFHSAFFGYGILLCECFFFMFKLLDNRFNFLARTGSVSIFDVNKLFNLFKFEFFSDSLDESKTLDQQKQRLL